MIDRSYLPIQQGLPLRGRLNDLLTHAVKSAVVTLVAGSGYGKTHTLASFAKTLPTRLIWIHIADIDNHLHLFCQRLLDAFRYEMPALAQTLCDIPFPETAEDFLLFHRHFRDAVSSGEHVTFVIDDFNAIKNPIILRFFRLLIQSRIKNFCLVLACNQKSDLAACGLKPSADVFDITQNDLCFTKEEVLHYLDECNIALSVEELDHLLRTSDGWPFAIQNFCKHYTRTSADQCLASLTSTVEEFFESAAFSNYAPPVRHVLVLLSSFEQFSRGVACAFAPEHSHAVMDAITQNNFITCDHMTGLFIPHRMYRQFLCRKLELYPRREIVEYGRLAAGRFLDDGYVFQAIESFSEYGDYDGLLRALDHLPCNRHLVSTSTQIIAHLDRLPPAYVQTHPSVEISKAYLYLNQADFSRVRVHLLDFTKKMRPREDEPALRPLLGEAYAMLADISIQQNTLDFPTYYKKAAAFLPEGCPHRNQAKNYVYNSNTFFLPHVNSGAFEEVIHAFFDATPSMEIVNGAYGYGMEYLFAAEASYLRGNIDDAIDYSYKAIYKATEKDQQDIVCNAHFVLLRAMLFQGNLERCNGLIAEINRIVTRHSDRELWCIRDSIVGWYYLALGDSARVPFSLTDDDYEQTLNYPFKSARTLSSLAKHMLLLQQYDDALIILSKLDMFNQGRGRWTLRLLTCVMRAVALLKTHHREKALDALHEAYLMAHDNGILLPFVEVGNTARSLIELAQNDKKKRFDDAWCSDILLKSAAFAKRLSAMTGEYRRQQLPQRKSNVALSKREHEALVRLAQGMQRSEIAALMQVSINSVKKYIAGIYNKLGAVNRADAIRLATQNGLLGDEE